MTYLPLLLAIAATLLALAVLAGLVYAIRALRSARPHGPAAAGRFRPGGRLPRAKGVLLLVALPIVLVAGIAGAVLLVQSEPAETDAGTPDSTAASEQMSTAPQPAEPPAMLEPPPPKPRDVPVTVLNGAGVTGAQSRIATRLRREKFQVTVRGDAPRSSKKTAIRWVDGGEEEARLISRKLAGTQPKRADRATASAAGRAKVVVIVGEEDAPQVTAPAPAEDVAPESQGTTTEATPTVP